MYVQYELAIMFLLFRTLKSSSEKGRRLLLQYLINKTSEVSSISMHIADIN